MPPFRPFRSLLVASLIAGSTLSGCNAVSEPPAEEPASPTISIMTFNVENLFDTQDDPGKDDKTFLPLTAKQNEEHITECKLIAVDRWREQCLKWDWNDAVLDYKLSVVAKAILQVDNGRGPDILALQEVENLGILERLRTEYLQPAGYLPGILLEGDDARGIDVAFLSRLELAEPAVLHPFVPSERFQDRAGDVRGVLEATFVLPDGTLLTGYSLHLPAPFHPTDLRIESYEMVNRLRDSLPEDRLAFAAGDFNTTSIEDSEQHMFARFWKPAWRLVHEDCRGCPGTAYYERNDNWSFLDLIAWAIPKNRGAHTTWDIRADSVKIANETPDQITPNGTPARFQFPEISGVSDHWPLVVEIEPTQKQ